MKGNLHPLRFFALLGFTILLITLLQQSAPAWEGQYTLTNRAPFNQPAFYPLSKTAPTNLYRPIDTWVGRLMLPTPPTDSDWVWIEIQQAPIEAKDLIGKTLKLEWSQTPDLQNYVQAVSKDVNFTPDIISNSQTTGNIYPKRLNQRAKVGPLQSIAGARPNDDAIVTLHTATLIRSQTGNSVLQINTEPVLETGRYYGLVKLLAPVADPKFTPKACPGSSPCPSELFRVQHYNSKTRQFNGPTETIRIPQQPQDSFGVYASTPRDLQISPAGSAGWYIYGAPDSTGRFTVQALKPRSLFQLTPQLTLSTQATGLDYINYENWKDTRTRKGTLQTVLLTPSSLLTPHSSPPEGTRALVMHLFGGRGGKGGENSAFGTVTGHFAYGIAQVIREPLADELQFDITYQQVYATNIEGIISGSNSWANYMGNLQRGWLGTRPIADVLVLLDTITQDYDFGGIKLSPLDEFIRQLNIITARYRIGDGTGGATVTPATSCVQDSNQALFITIQRIRQRVETSPDIQSWLSSHPNDPTTQRFQKLIALGDDLEFRLLPTGIVRQDWKQNADALSGTQSNKRRFTRPEKEGWNNTSSAIASWRTILPRQTQDELSTLFFQYGAQLWFLRTNQVGGNDPNIFPIAPTKVLGQWTLPGTEVSIPSVLFTRLLGAFSLPTWQDWLMTLGILAVYSAIALPLGFSQRFLRFQPWKTTRSRYLLTGLRLFLTPALTEELVFRILLLPNPSTIVTAQMWTIWIAISLTLFILYHPFNAKTLYKAGYPTFFDPIFLALTGLLGIACTFAYMMTHSLLTIAFIHWSVVVVWLFALGGTAKLHRSAMNK